MLDTGTYGIGGVSHQPVRRSGVTDPSSAPRSCITLATASVDGDVTELNSFDQLPPLTSVFDIEPQQGDVARTWMLHGIAVEDSFATRARFDDGLSRCRCTFAEGTTTLTVEAIYGDSTWMGSAFVDHAVPNLLGIDQLDAKVYVRDSRRDRTMQQLARCSTRRQRSTRTSRCMDRAEFKAAKAGDIDTLLNLDLRIARSWPS